MIEETIRQTATTRSPVRRALLASLLALAVVLLTLSSGTAAAATTFTVNSTDDAADIEIADDECDSDPDNGEQCTLRAAIEQANETSGADEIRFDIVEGTNPAKTISPASQLPPITDTVTIDGYTQTDSSRNTLAEGNDAVLNVQLDGLNAGADVHGLAIEAADCTVKGLLIRRFEGAGVRITGVDATGNRVEGNFLGINRDGITDRGNRRGVYIDGDSNTVGGLEPESRNVISGNDEQGVLISGFVSGNRVEGNYVGTTADGSDALGNSGDGVVIQSSESNTVGGTDAGARNVISGNDGSGVIVFASGAAENRVEGNYIGTTADGTIDLGNDMSGVILFIASNNTVGGTTANARNVISGNGSDGVAISGAASTDNRIEGNYVGTTANGSGDLGNGDEGVDLASGAANNTIGGTTGRAGNRIAHNGADGISIENNGSAGNVILSNSIHSNAELGIDLRGGTENISGVTANDTGDPDTGPNNLQNFPVISSATRSNSSGLTTISGKLNSDPSQDFTIQCFLTTNRTPAYGEGSRLLATTDVSTNANGSARFSCVSSSPIIGQIPGRTVTATATNTSGTASGTSIGDTSEFSRNETVTLSP